MPELLLERACIYASYESIKGPISVPVSPSSAVKCYPCREVTLNYNRSLPFHGGDTGSTPVRDANSFSHWHPRFRRSISARPNSPRSETNWYWVEVMNVRSILAPSKLPLKRTRAQYGTRSVSDGIMHSRSLGTMIPSLSLTVRCRTSYTPAITYKSSIDDFRAGS